ncbi:MAG: PhoPQ-activated pathogenicity-related protein PqaA type, partial [Armatimonadetes bacterium]|nr:PhoPQ-activated pathogenicity-related protein PqaA type [Armatimonadota bacterium]
PTGADPAFVQMALRTHSVVSELKMIPNEPLTFTGETMSRTEDAIIAYTWDRFLKTGDETWPLRLPMTKAAVRAMDTVTAFCRDSTPKKPKVEKFVVSGASKRGWTTWTTAAVDDRVVGIAPAVIDVLNVEASMRHHFRAYGFWAPAVQDYTRMNLQQRGSDDRYKALMGIEDPYSYRARLTMPKLILNSAGDQYFLPDSWQFYWKDLPGEKHLRYVPNTNHSLRQQPDVMLTLLAFYEGILAERPRPQFSWKVQKDGSIQVKTKDQPSEVRLWQATNPKARDFRLETVGPIYTSTVLEPEKAGVYTARVPKPAAGWTAFFVELTFPGGGTVPYKLTSGVHVVPDVLPFPAPGSRPETK